MKHSLSMLTARNISVSDFFSRAQAKGNYLLIVNHFAALFFFATERPKVFLSLTITRFAKKVLLYFLPRKSTVILLVSVRFTAGITYNDILQGVMKLATAFLIFILI